MDANKMTTKVDATEADFGVLNVNGVFLPDNITLRTAKRLEVESKEALAKCRGPVFSVNALLRAYPEMEEYCFELKKMNPGEIQDFATEGKYMRVHMETENFLWAEWL